MYNATDNTLALEQACKHSFAIRLTISEIIAANITAGIASQAVLFRTAQQNTHYLYVASPSGLTLGDVVQIIRRMGLVADEYLPPHADKDYFHRIGIEKFKQMFPGKLIQTADDTRYYESLARYNPALIRIAQIKGQINGYIPSSKQWRKIKDYSYTRMKVN